ncbi:MAG: beta-ribofuranosylaminobenzene 5'-phosphate synthase [Mariniblastus sp.]|jgi:beta-ribofuranosylaminobenzene 5'-phosphate synthase
MLEQVTVSAPARLHFGLFSVGDLVSRMFGGIGLMIDSPRISIQATRAEQWTVNSHYQPEINRAVSSWFDYQRNSLDCELGIQSFEQIPIELKVMKIPPRHCGLGTGTQLALSAAMAVIQMLQLPVPSIEELAIFVKRGKRSGIGSHGFSQGGFLVDRGKLAQESLAPLDFQTHFPDDWSIVTILGKQETSGLSGAEEIEAFQSLPKSTEDERSAMIEIVRDQIVPGVSLVDYDRFAAGVFDFGRRSGLMYEEIQNGPYNGQAIETLIREIREFGVPAVGQSSWGPCVFAITHDNITALRLKNYLEDRHHDNYDIVVSKADNEGAAVTLQGHEPGACSDRDKDKNRL